ncbi:SIMPL domain-containing protein [Spongiimicrobium salis]|uniref:SIMPL domain-containing protein n=1 Tax=Spongiimicrobium salis TaxID=1667022 RepID=UPI00374DC956
MKNTIILLFCCLPLWGISQEVSTIKVTGRAIHLDKTPTFLGSLTLSGTYSSYPSDAISLNQMKEKFNEALQKNGFSLSDIKENQLSYQMQGFEKEGTVYEIRTTSLQKMLQFVNIKSFGVQKFKNLALITIDAEENKILARKALENATLKAKGIAEAMGKKLGKVIRVEDFNNLVGIELENYLSGYEPVGKRIYELNVIYTVE